MKALVTIMVLAFFVGCDEAKAPTPPAEKSEAEKTAETVDDLVAKLPPPAPKEAPRPDVQFFGKFGTNGSTPTVDGERAVEVDAKAVSELNIVAQFRVESAFAERTVVPGESIIVQFGGEDADGLLVTVRYGGKSKSRKVPPATNGPELVSNLDHTVDRILNELGVPRRPPPGMPAPPAP